jgi:hypothetical protein
MMRIRKLLQVAPLTIAIGLGPAIDVVHFLTRTTEDQAGGASAVVRGSLMVLLALGIRRSRTLKELVGPMAPLLLLALYGFAWTAVREDAFEGLIFCMRLLFLVAVYLSAFECAAQGVIDARWMGRTAWLVLAMAVGSQAAGWLLHVSSVYESEFELPGLTGEPGMLAAAVCGVFPFFFFRTERRGIRVLGALVALASIAGTQRRSAILAVVVALIVFGVVVVAAERGRSVMRVLGLLVVFVAAAYVIVEVTPIGASLAARFDDLDVARGGTASGRTAFELIVIDRLGTRGVVDTMMGEGLGAVRRRLASEYGLAIGSHNDWLDVLYAFGIAGGALFAWLHVRLILLARRATGSVLAVASMSIMATLVLGVTAGGTLDPSAAPTFALFGFLSASAMAARRRARPVIGTLEQRTWAPG